MPQPVAGQGDGGVVSQSSIHLKSGVGASVLGLAVMSVGLCVGDSVGYGVSVMEGVPFRQFMPSFALVTCVSNL